MSDVVRRNLAKQREYYGELFGDRVRRVVVGFDISQAQLAATLGISAPMLSQVMSGRRQKLANPVVLARLVLLERTLRESHGPAYLREALAEVGAMSAAQAVLGAATDARPNILQGLRECGTPEELIECAELVRPVSPGLAHLLRQAGTRSDHGDGLA